MLYIITTPYTMKHVYNLEPIKFTKCSVNILHCRFMQGNPISLYNAKFV